MKLRDFTAEEILYLVDLAEELKEKRKKESKDTACRERILP